MRFSTLSALLVTATLAVTPQAVAFADPPVTSSFVTTTAPAISDTDRYAAREAKDAAIATFEGGREVIVIGTTTLALVLLVVIIVILL
jgi:hypothetical protein